jgi:hypothetical protein
MLRSHGLNHLLDKTAQHHFNMETTIEILLLCIED